MEKWKILDSEKLIENKWITVEKQKCEVGDGKIFDDYYIVKRSNYVVMVGEIGEEILFVKQYRHGVEDFILNLPMGMIGKEEEPEAAALREFMEETGHRAVKIDLMGEFFLNPAYTNVKGYVYYLRDLQKIDNNHV